MGSMDETYVSPIVMIVCCNGSRGEGLKIQAELGGNKIFSAVTIISNRTIYSAYISGIVIHYSKEEYSFQCKSESFNPSV